MWCLISLPNSVVLEVEVLAKSKGQECLDKICRLLGIIEVDYFGLQYRDNKGEMLWLNMRNQICRQLSSAPPYRFRLRVKFFVPPHLLMQESTRHLCYTHLKHDLIEGRLSLGTGSQKASLASFVAQAELGDYESGRCGDQPIQSAPSKNLIVTSWTRSEDYLLLFRDQFDVDQLRTIGEEHHKLQGLDRTAAEYRFLKEASMLEGFGMELFDVKMDSEPWLQLGVGTEGVSLYSPDRRLVMDIPYVAIQMATNTGKYFFLDYVCSEQIEDEEQIIVQNKKAVLTVRLESSKAASSLYRAVTEKHAFYSCETVRNAVTTQFVRDFKGTIVSLFNENTALGKKYMFDIRRTCHEVQDNARRVLHKMKGGMFHHQSPPKSNGCFDALLNTEGLCNNVNAGSNKENNCTRDSCMVTREKLATLQDSLLCRVCMHSIVSTSFCPCSHVACCRRCAAACSICPLCRADIEQTQLIYLPFQDQEAG